MINKYLLFTMAAGPQQVSCTKIFFNNVQSLRRRITTGELEAKIDEEEILGLCETWLNEEIKDEDLEIENFDKIERRDRLSDGYGGVAVYFKKNLAHKRRLDLENKKQAENTRCSLDHKTSIPRLQCLQQRN